MKFTRTQISGLVRIDMEPLTDERGAFARTFCAKTFTQEGLTAKFVQHSISRNLRRGTLRGLHYQIEPFTESKLVRCTAGAVFDVAVDLRRSSATFAQWFGLELSDANDAMLYIPEGCAHGFQTLTDNANVDYRISVPYSPAAARGVAWDDPQLGIDWPLSDQILSDADRARPLLRDAEVFE